MTINIWIYLLHHQFQHYFLERKLLFVKRAAILLCLLFTSTIINADPVKQLINKSLLTHPLILSSQSEVTASQADVESALWQYYPSPAVQVTTADATSSRTLTLNKPTTILSIEQPLWTGGRLTGGVDKAAANLNDSQEGLQQTRRDIALRVIQAYGDWYAANLRIQAWEESLATHFRLKGSVTRRFEEGVAANSDKKLAESRLESVIADLASTRAEEHVALSSLSQLAGEQIIRENILSLPSIPVLETNLDTMLQQAMTLSPAVQQALAQTDQVQADVSIQKSEYWPDVFLRLEHQFGNRQSTDSSSDSRISIGLRSTFGAGLSTFSASRSIQAKYQASLSQVDAQRRNINEQVQSDYYLANSFKARLSALKSASATTEEVFNSYNRQYLAGRKTWFDLLNSARDLVQAKIQLADAESANLVVMWRIAILTQELDLLIENVQSGNNG